jgi:hypothetical protein
MFRCVCMVHGGCGYRGSGVQPGSGVQVQAGRVGRSAEVQVQVQVQLACTFEKDRRKRKRKRRRRRRRPDAAGRSSHYSGIDSSPSASNQTHVADDRPHVFRKERACATCIQRSLAHPRIPYHLGLARRPRCQGRARLSLSGSFPLSGSGFDGGWSMGRAHPTATLEAGCMRACLALTLNHESSSGAQQAALVSLRLLSRSLSLPFHPHADIITRPVTTFHASVILRPFARRLTSPSPFRSNPRVLLKAKTQAREAGRHAESHCLSAPSFPPGKARLGNSVPRPGWLVTSGYCGQRTLPCEWTVRGHKYDTCWLCMNWPTSSRTSNRSSSKVAADIQRIDRRTKLGDRLHGYRGWTGTRVRRPWGELFSPKTASGMMPWDDAALGSRTAACARPPRPAIRRVTCKRVGQTWEPLGMKRKVILPAHGGGHAPAAYANHHDGVTISVDPSAA